MKKILIASASAGNGHVAAAQAMELAARSLVGTTFDIKNIDVFQPDYANRSVANLYSKGYIKLAKQMSELLGVIYNQTDRPWGEHGRKIGFQKLKRFIVDYQPDLIISTHFIPGEVVSDLLCRGKIHAASAIVVTDFDVHGMWFSRHYDRYFVAQDEAGEYLRKNRIAPERISVHGIPIKPVFAEHKDKAAMRAKYGLDPDLTTILLSSGGFGVGPVEKVLGALTEIEHPMQMVVLCGRNEELKERVSALAVGMPSAIRLLAVGFTDQMDEYMSAADIVLGKPGGLTTSEALAKALAFAIFSPIPGQEERNSDHLLEEHAAIRFNELDTLAYKLGLLLGDQARLRMMQTNARRIGRPNAALDIMRTLLSAPAHHHGTKCGINNCQGRI